MLRRTPLYPYHKDHGNIVEFAGFQMPLFFGSIQEEHMAVRNSVGIFDVSHMGRSFVEGEEARSFLNYVTANDVSQLYVGKCQYTMLCNKKGGVVDDGVVSRISDDQYLFVYNASNREKDYNWMKSHLKTFNTSLRDVSDSTIMLAVQGPKAEEVLVEEYPAVKGLNRFHVAEINVNGEKAWISRTGYTGEDGFEITLWIERTPRNFPLEFWSGLLNLVEKNGGSPCGLGARDTLRLEAGLCLYGSDLTDEITPLEAGYSWLVKFDKGDFVGKDVLEERKGRLRWRRMGLNMVDQGIPRHGYKIYNDNGIEIGFVSSGTFSPLLRKGVGSVYVEVKHAVVGGTVYVDLRRRRAKAELADFPLYDEDKYGWKRRKP